MAKEKDFDGELLKRLAKFAEKEDLVELEYQSGDLRIRLVRKLPPIVGSTPAGGSLAEQSDAGKRLITFKAPMVGTFYAAPSPDSEPFVKVGDLVEKGQVLCIIEALKLMNEIESQYRGYIREIMVENAQPVQYGTPLFVIEIDE